jgi:hypothetical protein
MPARAKKFFLIEIRLTPAFTGDVKRRVETREASSKLGVLGCRMLYFLEEVIEAFSDEF